MPFQFTQEYRESDEYKQWVALIKKDYPNYPLYLIELAIMAHKNDPQAYKKDKDAKKYLNSTPQVKVGTKDTIVPDAIRVFRDTEKDTHEALNKATLIQG